MDNNVGTEHPLVDWHEYLINYSHGVELVAVVSRVHMECKALENDTLKNA